MLRFHSFCDSSPATAAQTAICGIYRMTAVVVGVLVVDPGVVVIPTVDAAAADVVVLAEWGSV